MAKSKCPVCSVPVARVENMGAGWNRLCRKHEYDSHMFPEAKFLDDDSVLVRGKMIEEASEGEEDFYGEDFGDDDFSDMCEDDYAA